MRDPLDLFIFFFFLHLMHNLNLPKKYDKVETSYMTKKLIKL